MFFKTEVIYEVWNFFNLTIKDFIKSKINLKDQDDISHHSFNLQNNRNLYMCMKGLWFVRKEQPQKSVYKGVMVADHEKC